jgi:hypothetical protein
VRREAPVVKVVRLGNRGPCRRIERTSWFDREYWMKRRNRLEQAEQIVPSQSGVVELVASRIVLWIGKGGSSRYHSMCVCTYIHAPDIM